MPNSLISNLNAGKGPDNPELRRDQALVFGPDALLCACGQPIERGSGALPPAEQCIHVHLPYILATQGPTAAAEAALKRLDGKVGS
jgi:hypothetical protein